MKRKLISLWLFVLLIFVMSGCCISHTWVDATCTEAQTCSKCGKTEGEALGHKSWNEATCTSPKTCKDCGKTEGKPLGHKKGDWELITEPQGGKPGVEAKLCTVCDEVLEQRDFLYPYFDISFEEYMKLYNKNFASLGCKIKETNAGFSVYMNGKEVGLIFHDDLNMKKDGTATAYSTVKKVKFNSLKFRMVDSGATVIDYDMLTYAVLLGGTVTQPVTDSDFDTFIDDFLNHNQIIKSTDSKYQSESVFDGYKYIVNVYPFDLGAFKDVTYEFSCYPDY